jgi:hypothetical protein
LSKEAKLRLHLNKKHPTIAFYKPVVGTSLSMGSTFTKLYFNINKHVVFVVYLKNTNYYKNKHTLMEIKFRLKSKLDQN